jgi:hypothetical protein
VADADWLHSPKICRMEGCTNKGASRGTKSTRRSLCNRHYRESNPGAARRHSKRPARWITKAEQLHET